MKHEYIAYTREINGQLFYFVKHHLVVPEVQNINPVLAGYGMHKEFDHACAIAGINDVEQRKIIFENLQAKNEQAKVISMINFKTIPGKKIS